MKFKEYKIQSDSITEMANLSKRDHHIDNIKINIRQPGKSYPHDISVKVFANKNDYWIIRINRRTGELFEELQPVQSLDVKTKKKVIKFIKLNYLNFVSLWDDSDLAIDDLIWEH